MNNFVVHRLLHEVFWSVFKLKYWLHVEQHDLNIANESV